jgi:hypothetical protein
LKPLLLASFEAFFCFNLLFLPEEKQVGIITKNKLSFSLVSSLLHLEENHEPIVYKPHCASLGSKSFLHQPNASHSCFSVQKLVAFSSFLNNFFYDLKSRHALLAPPCQGETNYFQNDIVFIWAHILRNAHHMLLVNFEKAPGKYPGLLQ